MYTFCTKKIYEPWVLARSLYLHLLHSGEHDTRTHTHTAVITRSSAKEKPNSIKTTRIVELWEGRTSDSHSCRHMHTYTYMSCTHLLGLTEHFITQPIYSRLSFLMDLHNTVRKYIFMHNIYIYIYTTNRYFSTSL